MPLHRRIVFAAMLLCVICLSLAGQNSGPRIVYRSRAYRRVGASHAEWWEIDRTTQQKVEVPDAEAAQKQSTCAAPGQAIPRFKRTLTALSPNGKQSADVSVDNTQLRITSATDGKEIANILLPSKSEYWNYPTSLAWSPDGDLILVGAEAGSSDAHFEDYWLLDWTHQKWQYAGGGNDAKWSPDGLQIAWTTKRNLAPLGSIHVWVSHLVLLDASTLKQQTLTSGVSYESDFFWCAR